MEELILASQSPRRRDLLTRMGCPFRQIPSEIEETVDLSLSPDRLVVSLARQKAESVYKKYGGMVLGVDTVVCFEGRIFGKPRSEAEAAEMLATLSGNVHDVWTGYCLLGIGEPVFEAVRSAVKFRKLTAEEIASYIATGAPMDKAGAYGVQDPDTPVENVTGSLTNVMGLPTERLKKVFEEKRLWE